MAIQKNFVVKNGLEVATALLIANSATQKVGIGTTNPTAKLEVSGEIKATQGVYVSGIATAVNELNVGVGGTTLAVTDSNGFVGINSALPIYNVEVRKRAGAGLTAAYFDGQVDVTGSLIADNIGITSSKTKDLNVTGFSTFVGFSTFESNVHIRGDLTFDESTGRNQNITGVTTLTTLRIGNTNNITAILDEDNMASNSATALPTQQSVKAYVDAEVTAQDLDFQGDSGGAQSVDLDSQSLTIAGTTNEIETAGSAQTITIGLPSDVTIGDSLTVTNDASVGGGLTVTGISTFTGTSKFGSNATFDSTSTFNDDVTLTGASGNIVFDKSDNALEFDDNVKATFGADSDLKIVHNGSNSIINDEGTGDLYLGGNANVNITNSALNEFKAKFITDGAVKLYYDNVRKLETIGYGVSITNDLTVGTAVSVYGNTGIVSATSFFGDGSNLTGVAPNLIGAVGVKSEGVLVGTAVTMLDFVTTTGDNVEVVSAASTATVKIQPGVSIGLAIALGS